MLLTGVTTVGGLAPLMIDTDSHATILIPMAIAIVFGVIFATVLTLVLIPCVFAILNDFRLLAYRVMSGKWPKRNDLEPASRRRLSEEALQIYSLRELKQI